MSETRLPVVLMGDLADLQKYDGLAHFIAAHATPEEVLQALVQGLRLGASYSAAGSPEESSSRAWQPDFDASGSGKVLTLVGGKGAPGVTTTAIGLAYALSKLGRRVVLVDADLRAGNVLAYLNLSPVQGILGLAAGNHDSSLPVESELQDGPGVGILVGLERPEDYVFFTPTLVTAILASLRELADVVIVDAGQITSATSPETTEALLRQADGILLVCMGDLVGAWNARCCQRHLVEHLGLSPGGIALILNHYERRGQYSAAELASFLGLEAVGTVPEDRTALYRAVAAQIPAGASGGKVGRAFRGLANELTGRRQPAAREKTKGKRWTFRRVVAGGRR
jgi:flagellar biosynthesis protein FlhG